MSAWFASERWIFVQHKGQKWLEEVISEATNRLANTRIARTSRISLRWCSMRIAAARGHFRRLTKWIVKPKQPKELLPIVEPAQPRTRARAPPRPVYHQEPAAFMPKPEAALSLCSLTTENLASTTEGRSDETTDTRRSHARQRFVNAIRSVIMLQSTARPMSPRRNSSFDTPIVFGSAVTGSAALPMSPGRFPDPGMSMRGARVTSAIDKLKVLETSQEMAAHQALVRHLQFSPNGRYLATSR